VAPLVTDEQIAEWVFTTCRIFGASLATSYLVAGEFIRGLEWDRNRATRAQKTEPEPAA
jgi:hypothetical protein